MMTCLIGDAVFAAASKSLLWDVAPAKPVVAASSVNENDAALVLHFLAHFPAPLLAHFLGILPVFRMFVALHLDYETADFEIARGRLSGNCLSCVNL
jgi:hypothetical protein